MKRTSEVERESPLKRFKQSVRKVISSLAVIRQLKQTEITELVTLDIVRHGERSDTTIDVPDNTHIINISITPIDCMMPTSYSTVLQNDISAFFFNRLESKLGEIIQTMTDEDSERGFEEFKEIITRFVSGELKREAYRYIRKIGRVDFEKQIIRVTKATPEELCEITVDTEINNKRYSVKTLSEKHHSIIEFDKGSRSSRKNTSMIDDITTQKIIDNYRERSKQQHLWIVLLDSTCNVIKRGGKHLKKTRRRKTKYNKRKSRRVY